MVAHVGTDRRARPSDGDGLSAERVVGSRMRTASPEIVTRAIIPDRRVGDLRIAERVLGTCSRR